jgi:lipoprotein NlpD
MSSKPGRIETGFINRAGALLVLLGVLLMQACSYHPPAPVEDHSSGIVKRQLNSDGSYYVRSGDTLYAIAFGYGVDPLDVAKWNNISSPYTIYPGQLLRLSPPSAGDRNRDSSSDVQISAIKAPGQVSTRAVSDTGSSTQAGSGQSDSTRDKPSATKSASITASPTASLPATAPTATAAKTPQTNTSGKSAGSSSTDPNHWLWPTKGRVHRTYIAGDPARNGLDIAGKEGQAINASAAGQVVYSGNGLIGYGELIIIKHSDKMLSAYAHNKLRLVSEGDQVSAGQKIAEMGRNTGNEQLLHFEIREIGKPVDPLIYLPRK